MSIHKNKDQDLSYSIDALKNTIRFSPNDVLNENVLQRLVAGGSITFAKDYIKKFTPTAQEEIKKLG